MVNDKNNKLKLISGSIDTPSLKMTWEETPWDSRIFKAPVLQIGDMKILNPQGARTDIEAFVSICRQSGAFLVSCRLDHDSLRESLLLEDIGFRFIEMAYRPEVCLDSSCAVEHGLTVSQAVSADLPEIIKIAGTVFFNERIHVDPRLPSRLGDIRYQNWVSSSFEHPKQRLYAIRENGFLVAFFITEDLPDGTCYWHLTAVALGFQGKGYGRRTWVAMMECARMRGMTRIQTCIVARNHRVLNLYAQLGFRFSPPTTTFHWVAEP